MAYLIGAARVPYDKSLTERLLVRALLGTAWLTPAFGCSVNAREPVPSACEGPNCVVDAGPTEPTAGEVNESDAAPVTITGVPDAGLLLPVCSGGCMADEPEACGDFKPAAPAEISDKRKSTRVRALRLSPLEIVDSGTPIAAPPKTGLSDDGGLSRFPDAGGGEVGEYACQFTPSRGKLVTACGLAGSGASGDACQSSRDCAPGLGCAGEPGTGQCLEYCCGGDASCEQGRFCADRPLHTGDGKVSPGQIPVCARTQACNLGEAFPCEGGDCTCPGDFSCTVVSAKGNTGCVMRGDGTQAAACPCAPGYFCAPATMTCLRLCEVNKNDMCGDHTCQAGPNFPDGWGLCIGLP